MRIFDYYILNLEIWVLPDCVAQNRDASEAFPGGHSWLDCMLLKDLHTRGMPGIEVCWFLSFCCMHSGFAGVASSVLRKELT